jgi:hypothetical protein
VKCYFLHLLLSSFALLRGISVALVIMRPTVVSISVAIFPFSLAQIGYEVVMISF